MLHSPLKPEWLNSTPRQFDDTRNVPYHEATGSLMYAMIGTRPDTTFAVTALSQYLQNPGHPHWEQANRSICYLKGTRDWKLVFRPTGGVEGFTDANWGNDVDNRHSICSCVFTLNGGAISWSSKKQSVVALSSTVPSALPSMRHSTTRSLSSHGMEPMTCLPI